MPINALLRWVTLFLWLAAVTTFASADCDEPNGASRVSVDSASGRQLLGQGISLYNARKLDTAEKALQASLFAGLPDHRERSTAHRYLAFVYCTNKEWARCDAAFDAAFEARPSFSLEEYELQGTAWREAYLKAQGRRGWRCDDSLHRAGGTERPDRANPHSFALNSTVIAAITPLLSVIGFQQASHEATPTNTPFSRTLRRSDNNIQLRVSPWANVNLNGKRLGVTPPLTEIKLPAGSHTIDLINPGFETVRKSLKVEPGQTTTITHDFDAR
jgi:hypothetical protein